MLWQLEPATAAKHHLYASYLDAWWPIVLQQRSDGYLPPRVTYVDAFAGPGKYLGGEDGSPLIALGRLLGHSAVDRMFLSRERVCLVFIEEDRPRYEYLLGQLNDRFGRLADLPVRVEVRHDEARNVEGVLSEVGAWGRPVLAIFDSWGNVNVPLSVMRRIAHNRSSEVIVTFGPNWFSRREGLDAASLDAVFGGREHWKHADRGRRPAEHWRTWLAIYRDALKRSGFPYQLSFSVVPGTGLPLYLIFGTGHPRGVEVMKDAMWDVDGNDGLSFKDPRTRGAPPAGQLTLWADRAQPELLELVAQRLQLGPIAVEELGQWLLVETSRWQKKHAMQAVQEMVQDGMVIVSPPGRVTRASAVRLR